ncbi:MAG: hypothetical protein ACLFUG_08785 [Nitriliruptoraceae bacterium]
MTMVFGVAILLGFLLLATQVLVHLYATSTVTAVAFDEARRASTDGGGCEGVEGRVRDRLGGWAGEADVEVRCTAGQPGIQPTVVRVRGPSPAQALRIFGRDAIARIDRSASFLTEPAVGP